MALSISLNVAQKRLTRPRMGVFSQGGYPSDDGTGMVSGWSRQLMASVWVEPIGQNLLLQPRCLDAAWPTTFTGDYARLGFADFGLADGTGGWRVGGINQARMANDGGTSAAVVSSATYGGDRGFYVSYFATDGGTGESVDLEVGYGASGSATDPACRLALQFMKGGTVNVRRGGQPAGQGSVGARLTGFQEIVVLPMNLREVLVYSLTNAAGFIFVCEDVAETDPRPRIVPNAKFWFYRPSGAVDVEIAPLRFAAAGSAMSTKRAFAARPGALESPETPEVFRRNDQGGTVTPTLVDISGAAYNPSTAATDPNPTYTNGCRLKVALTGSGSYTPTVQGAVGGYPAVVGTTTAAVVELRERAMHVRLSVPESATDVRASFSIMGKEAGVDDSLWDLARLTNLPIEMSLGSLAPFFRGQSGATPAYDGASDPARSFEAEFRDEWALVENARYIDPYPFDGLSITDALKRALKHARGPAVAMDVEDNSFVLPVSEGAALGQWGEMARATDPSCDVLRHMLETYASTWAYGYFPSATGPLFRAGSLAGLFGSDPITTLYPSIDLAATVGGHDPDPNSPDAAWRFVYKDFSETRLKLEANDVRVTGFDPKLRRVIQSSYIDAASIDPSSPPSGRPDNWEGEILPLVVVDPRVTTQPAADRACGILAGRTTQRRVIASFSAEMLRRPGATAGSLAQPLWRTDVVLLYGKGVYRINTLDAEWIVSEPDPAGPVRPAGGLSPFRRCKARYTATKGAGAALGVNSVGAGFSDVMFAHEVARGNRSRVRPGGETLLRRPVSVRSNATLLGA